MFRCSVGCPHSYSCGRFCKDVVPGLTAAMALGPTRILMGHAGRRATAACATAVAPGGRFTASVLGSLRVLLWDRISGSIYLLTPPIAGGDGGAVERGGLAVNVAVATGRDPGISI